METIKETYKVIVKQNGKQVAEFTNQESDIKGFRYIQTHQGQSVDYAVKYSGWSCEIYSELTGKCISKY